MSRDKLRLLLKKPPALKDTPLAAPYFRLLSEGVWPFSSGLLDDPDHYTLASLLLALLVPVGFRIHPIAGAFFMLLSGVADSLSDVAAEKTGRNTPLAAFLNSMMDRVRDFLFLFGFWVLFFAEEDPLPAAGLVFASYLLLVLFNFARTRAEGLGVTCTEGLMERGFRTLYLIVWAVFLGLFASARANVLWGGFILFDLLLMAALVQRLVEIQGSLMGRAGKG